MDLDHQLYYVSVYLHVLGAIIWLGGSLFYAIVLVPALKNHPARKELILKTGKIFRIISWITLGVILLTGLYNLHYHGLLNNLLFESKAGQLALLKMLLFAFIILLGLLHDVWLGPKLIDKTQKYPLIRWIARVMVILGLVMVWLGIKIVRG